MVQRKKSIEELEANTEALAKFCIEQYGNDPGAALAALTEIMSEYIKLANDPDEGYKTACEMLRAFLNIKSNRYIVLELVPLQ